MVRWHRKSFRYYWTWKSRAPGFGRSSIDPEVRELIREMSRANPFWGAPRIHGELLKLDIHVSQATVSKYMHRSRKPPSQSWRTFLDNHVQDLVSIDFLTVPTATFRVLYVFIVFSHDRRRVVHFSVTEHPTAQWTAQQIIEAFPFDTAPKYLIILLNETHVRRILRSYFSYYHDFRTHLPLDKDAPVPREQESRSMGKVIALSQVGGLHHRYTRRAA